MNLFETLKEQVAPELAAARYGLPVRRGGMACCPFHPDRTPSMKLYPDHFHCFGCQKTGDVIDLTAQIIGLTAYDAAHRLAEDFGIPIQQGQAQPQPPLPQKHIPYHQTQQFKEDERLCFSVLMGYLHLLWDWKEKYSPKTPDEPLDDRFVEACQMESRIEYLCDIFITGDTGERAAVLRELLDTDRIAELKEYTERKYKEERRIEQRRKRSYDLAV